METIVPSIVDDNDLSSTKQMTFRRTFNICDILAKPSSFIDSHTSQIHQLKFLFEQRELNDSISDCDVSGKEVLVFCENIELILF